ncbi:GNAT family N-acetyltransferase [Bacillus marinisedimentorum]|uniref:GNAT family N-acetyltransferase n=1 Tax=Bacillus marinisedimentorum TaxID=1821260 RepID=UPI00087265B1|nr:GNAT family N-acetyltransferase [Bacillus marinisedimentorum]
MKAVIKTERLLWVSFTVDLIKAAMAGRNELAAKLGYHVAEDWPQRDFEDIFPFLLRQREENPESSGWSGLVIHQTAGTLIGDAGFKGVPDRGEVEIGYSIVPAYQGNGYATEITKALTELGLNQPGVERITADCLKDNTASIRVLEKSGFYRAKEAEDLIYWKMEAGSNSAR